MDMYNPFANSGNPLAQVLAQAGGQARAASSQAFALTPEIIREAMSRIAQQRFAASAQTTAMVAQAKQQRDAMRMRALDSLAETFGRMSDRKSAAAMERERIAAQKEIASERNKVDRERISAESKWHDPGAEIQATMDAIGKYFGGASGAPSVHESAYPVGPEAQDSESWSGAGRSPATGFDAFDTSKMTPSQQFMFSALTHRLAPGFDPNKPEIDKMRMETAKINLEEAGVRLKKEQAPKWNDVVSDALAQAAGGNSSPLINAAGRIASAMKSVPADSQRAVADLVPGFNPANLEPKPTMEETAYIEAMKNVDPNRVLDMLVSGVPLVGREIRPERWREILGTAKIKYGINPADVYERSYGPEWNNTMNRVQTGGSWLDRMSNFFRSYVRQPNELTTGAGVGPMY